MHPIERAFRAFERLHGGALDRLDAEAGGRPPRTEVARALAPTSVRLDGRVYPTWVDTVVGWAAYRRVRRVYVVHARPRAAAVPAAWPRVSGAGYSVSLGRRRVHLVAYEDRDDPGSELVVRVVELRASGALARLADVPARPLAPDLRAAGESAVAAEVQRRAHTVEQLCACWSVDGAAYVDGHTSLLVREPATQPHAT